MARPYFNHSTEDLEKLFRAEQSCLETLLLLREELTNRKKPKAKVLLKLVEDTIGHLTRKDLLPTPEYPKVGDADQGSGHRHSGAGNSAGPSTGGSGSADDLGIPDDLQIPPVFTKMRPPGTSGLPDPYERERANDVSLGLPKDADILDVYIRALDALISEIKMTGAGDRRYELENGNRVESPHDQAMYAFPFTDDAEVFEDAQVTFEIHRQRYEGTIVSVGAGKLLVAIDRDFGDQIQRAVLLVDATALLRALKDKLEKAKGNQIAINRSLSDAVIGRASPPANPPPIPSHISSVSLKERQQEAYRQALTASMTRIWGPPGSGKTVTLGAIVRSAYESNKRVLVCSNTNKAVDRVLLKVCDAVQSHQSALKEGHVVRLGSIADDLFKNNYAEYVTIEAIVVRRSQEWARRKTRIEDELRRIDARTGDARRVLALFSELDKARLDTKEITRQFDATKNNLNQHQSELTRLDSRLDSLQAEMQKRQNSRFVLFQRSLEEISRNINETHADRERQLRLVNELRLVAESININLLTAQRTEQRSAEAVRGLDRSGAQKEVDEANFVRDELVDELREIDAKMAALRAAVLKDARVVGATCTKASLSVKELGQFDFVIIDEVSMVIPPMAWFVAGLSKERVIICGDPRQIPPIVPTQKQAIFEVLGHDVLEGREKERDTAKLNVQYRMDAAICDLISTPMYRDMGGLDTATTEQAVCAPVPYDCTLTIVDTSELWPFETVTAFKSRFNLMHALLVRNLGWYLSQSGYIDGDQKRFGVCTPYAAQSKLIHKLFQGSNLNDVITTGTVHRYQGDECETMVLDIPESHGGSRYVGQFVQGVPPSHVGARLLNVAVSRAKSNLIVIANVTYLDARLPSSSLLRSILYTMQEKGRIVSAKDLLELRPIEDDLKGLVGKIDLDENAEKFGLFDERSFDDAVRLDFIAAKSSIVIFSGFITPQRVGQYGDLLRAKVADGVKVRCVTRPPHLNGSISPELGKQALDMLEGVGCAVDCRANIHQKVVLVDNEIVWHGSLNALSHSHRTEESMTRIVNSGLAEALGVSLAKRRLGADKAASRLAQAENPRCQRCNSRTVYDEGRYGPYFYCENRKAQDGCNWSMNLTAAERDTAGQDDPKPASDSDTGTQLVCPKCGGPTVLRSGKRGNFYGCKKYPSCDGIAKSSRAKKAKANGRAN